MGASLYPDPRTVTPREVLHGLRGIVEREQMGHDGYIGHGVNRELAEAGALCRGHRDDDCGYLIEPRDMLVVIDRAEELIA